VHGRFPVLRRWNIIVVTMLALTHSALAGPPYVSDDPEPTDYKHFEIYTFSNGTATRGDIGGASGIDFNYGAAPNLQLTATLPAGFDRPGLGRTIFGLSNIELAAKYRFLHQDSFGLDVSVFPRVFLPSGSTNIGNNTASLLLPVWVQKDWSGGWSAFGGGGWAPPSGEPEGLMRPCSANRSRTFSRTPKACMKPCIGSAMVNSAIGCSSRFGPR